MIYNLEGFIWRYIDRTWRSNKDKGFLSSIDWCRYRRVQLCYYQPVSHQPQELCYQYFQEKFSNDHCLNWGDPNNFFHWNLTYWNAAITSLRINILAYLKHLFLPLPGKQNMTRSSPEGNWNVAQVPSSNSLGKSPKRSIVQPAILLIFWFLFTFYFMHNKNTCVFSLCPPNKNISPFSFAEHE